MNDEKLKIYEEVGRDLSRACDWKGNGIVIAFCEALTDANYHKERKEIVPILNKLFNLEINPIG